MKSELRLVVWFCTGVFLAACGATGEGSGCACDPDYEYPRGLAEAAPAENAALFRFTQHGLNSAVSLLPSLLETICKPSEAGAADCEEVEVNGQRRARFYIGSPCFPKRYVTNLGTILGQVNAEIRSGDCRGEPYFASYVEIGLDGLLEPGNLELRLYDGPGVSPEQAALELVLGCQDALDGNLGNCFSEQFLKMDLEMVWESEYEVASFFGGGIMDNACYIKKDDGEEWAAEIQGMRVLLKPKLRLDDQGRPKLDFAYVMADSELKLDLHLEQDSADGNGSPSDPACVGGGCDALCESSDFVGEGAQLFLESRRVATLIAEAVVDALLAELVDMPLEALGEVKLTDFLPVGNSHANATAFLITPHLDTPTVTGTGLDRGVNFYFKGGFFGEADPCVPEVSPMNWTVPSFVSETSTVQTSLGAPEGETIGVGYDAMVALSEGFLERAVYNLFSTGNLCLDLAAGDLRELSGGAFTPTVSFLSLLAPGLVDLGPPETPVMISLSPKLPMRINFRSDSEEGLVQVMWPQVEVSLYPQVGDSSFRAVSFGFDLRLGLDLAPTPEGGLRFLIKELALVDLQPWYNEANIDFSPENISELLESFLPLLFSQDDPIDINFGEVLDEVGMTPRFLAMKAEEPGEHLGVYVRLCSRAATENESDPICHGANLLEGEAEMHGERGGNFYFHGGAIPSLPIRSGEQASALQVGYRIGGKGPWYGFYDLEEDGSLLMAHPLLRYPGTHRVDYVTRNRQDVHEWSRMETVWVNIDAPFWQGTKKVEKGAGVALSDAPSTENIDGFQRSDFGIYSERDAVEGGCRQTGVEAPWWFILMLAGGSIVGRRRSDLRANRL